MKSVLIMKKKEEMEKSQKMATIATKAYFDALNVEKERLIRITKKILVQLLTTKVYHKDLCVIKGYTSRRTKYYTKINKNDIKIFLEVLNKNDDEIIEEALTSSLTYNIHTISKLLDILLEIQRVDSFYL